jgi:hypothetical protein
MSNPRTIIIPAAERIKTGERGLVSFKVGEAFEQYLVHLFRYQEIGGSLSVTSLRFTEKMRTKRFT